MSELSQPISWWDRTTAGITGFFSHAVSYVPRGILFVLGAATVSVLAEKNGFSGLGITKMTDAQFFTHGLSTIALGGLISGGLGGVGCACNPSGATTQTSTTHQPRQPQPQQETTLQQVAGHEITHQLLGGHSQHGLPSTLQNISEHLR